LLNDKLGVHVRRRTENEIIEFTGLTYCESIYAIHPFAGADIEKPKKLIRLSVLLLLLFTLNVTAGEPVSDKQHRLALLIIAPWEGEVAMHNDLIAMREALILRGFSKTEILSLEGRLNRSSFMSFLQKARGRMAGWRRGELFFYFGGHGIYTGSDVAESRPGLWFRRDLQQNPKYTVYWDEVFATLNVSENIKVTLLPDS
jgi:hypothetical protein